MMNVRMTSKRIYNPKECKPSLWQTCALIKYSPYNFFSPMLRLRVKNTSIPKLPPMFPNTIACTLIVVPLKQVISLIMQYFEALELSHESKIAFTTNCNCFHACFLLAPLPFSSYHLLSFIPSLLFCFLPSLVWLHVVAVAIIFHCHNSNPFPQQRYVHEEDLCVAYKFKACRRCNGWTLQQEGEAIDIIIALVAIAIAKKWWEKKIA